MEPGNRTVIHDGDSIEDYSEIKKKPMIKPRDQNYGYRTKDSGFFENKPSKSISQPNIAKRESFNSMFVRLSLIMIK